MDDLIKKLKKMNDDLTHSAHLLIDTGERTGKLTMLQAAKLRLQLDGAEQINGKTKPH